MGLRIPLIETRILLRLLARHVLEVECHRLLAFALEAVGERQVAAHGASGARLFAQGFEQGDGLIELPVQDQRHGEIVLDRQRIGGQLQSALIQLLCRQMISRMVEGYRFAVIGHSVLRIDGDQTIEHLDRLLRSSPIHQRVTELRQYLLIIRVFCLRFAHDLDGVLRPARLTIGFGQLHLRRERVIGARGEVAIDADGACIVPGALEIAGDAHLMGFLLTAGPLSLLCVTGGEQDGQWHRGQEQEFHADPQNVRRALPFPQGGKEEEPGINLVAYA